MSIWDQCCELRKKLEQHYQFQGISTEFIQSVAVRCIRNIVGLVNGAPNGFPSEEFILSFGVEELDAYRRIKDAFERFQDSINHEIAINGYLDFISSNYISHVFIAENNLFITVDMK